MGHGLLATLLIIRCRWGLRESPATYKTDLLRYACMFVEDNYTHCMRCSRTQIEILATSVEEGLKHLWNVRNGDKHRLQTAPAPIWVNAIDLAQPIY